MAAGRIRATPLHHDGHDYLTTAQVSRTLGIKPESVYAYVSRGLLHSVRIAGVNGSVFSIGEVEALVGRGGRTRPPSGVVERIRTHITLIENDTLFFRGRNAADLAVSVPSEQVCSILWAADTRGYESHSALKPVRRFLSQLPNSTNTFDAMTVAVDLFRALDKRKYDTSPGAVVRTITTLVDGVIDALPRCPGAAAPQGNSRAERLWPVLSSTPATEHSIAILDAALVLLADHDLCASTMAARVAASSRANIYSVMSAGLGALDGPLHGGAATLAYSFLGAALTDCDNAIATYQRAGLRIPGFGHVVYQQRDPRADAILALLPGDNPVHNIIADARDQSFPNIDVALAAYAHTFDMTPEAPEVIFAIARMAGWTAHALEEYRESELRFRPVGVYTGVRPT